MENVVEVARGTAPLILSIPHAGTNIPPDIEDDLDSPWLARKDADWWIDDLYDFAGVFGCSVVRATTSRTVIDVNRDPSGRSLYPGQITSELCPTKTFDGEPLYRPDRAPDDEAIARRHRLFFEPYHAALSAEIGRLRDEHGAVVLYDCHAIRSIIPRLFDGELPHMNIGTNSGASCDPALQGAIEAVCDRSRFTRVSNGRFKGGWITRHYGRPETGVHAVQMELACRSYMPEPAPYVTEANWPPVFDPAYAAPMRETLRRILKACVDFAASQTGKTSS